MIKDIRSFYGWAIAEEYLAKNPAKTIKDSCTEKRRRPSLTKEEFEKVRLACNTSRERALVEFLVSSGCRVSECASIKMDEIDWNDRSVSVIGKGNKERIVRFDPATAVHIKRYLKEGHQSKYLFGRERFNEENLKNEKPLSRERLEKEIRDIASRSGIGKKLTPHVLRHTYATFLIEAGMPIQSVQMTMGHASINTTMHYCHQSVSSIKADYERYAS